MSVQSYDEIRIWADLCPCVDQRCPQFQAKKLLDLATEFDNLQAQIDELETEVELLKAEIGEI